jgi:DNA-binding cell septation regulator SpoVG
MASIKAKKAAATASKSTADKENPSVEVTFPRKVSFENNPTLVGFFSVTTEGLPLFGNVSLTEKEDDKFSIFFPYKKYQDKNGETQTQSYIHPISKEVRDRIQETVVKAFEDVVDEKFVETDKEEIEKALESDKTIIRFPVIRDIPTFEELVGNASFVTTEKMAMHDVELHHENGKYHLRFPSRRYQDANKEWKAAPHCGTFNTEAAKAITEAAVEAFKAEGLID